MGMKFKKLITSIKQKKPRKTGASAKPNQNSPYF